MAHPSCQVEPLGLNEEVLVRNMLDRDYQNFVSAGVSGNPHNCSFEILREDFSDGDSEQVLRLSFAGFLRELEKEQQVCYGGFRIQKQC